MNHPERPTIFEFQALRKTLTGRKGSSQIFTYLRIYNNSREPPIVGDYSLLRFGGITLGATYRRAFLLGPARIGEYVLHKRCLILLYCSLIPSCFETANVLVDHADICCCLLLMPQLLV